MVPVRYAVDAHAIGQRLTGNEVYVRSLLGAFASLDKDSEFLAYISHPEAEACIPERVRLRYVSTNPFVRLGYQMGRRLAQDCPALVHVQYTSPLFCSVPCVVSVHDVSFLEHPEYFTWERRRQLKITVARSVRRSAKILTVSEFSRGTILRAYDVDPDNVIVVPDAGNPQMRVVNPVAAARRAEASFGIRGPFIFSVGDLQPRKNQIGLIHAFAELVRSDSRFTHRLVLAGKDTWFSHRVREAARRSGVEDRISFLGFVSDEDLLQLYNACSCFVFPSFYEGFGMPILEAMACGRAVITSKTSAMPEVADGAGLLCDPHNTAEIVRAMRDVLLDSELRSRMERLGLQRAAGFTWQKSARMTLDVYEQVAAKRIAERPLARAAHRG